MSAHAGLVAHEVAGHAAHEGCEGPEGEGVVLEDGVDGGEEIGHALDVGEVLRRGVATGVGPGGGGGGVVFEVGEEHVFELFEVDICAVAVGDGEGGGGVRVWDVFAGEEGDVPVGPVDVFFYGEEAEVSGLSDAVCERRKGLQKNQWGLCHGMALPMRPFCSFHHSSSSRLASPSTILSHQAPFRRMNSSLLEFMSAALSCLSLDQS